MADLTSLLKSAVSSAVNTSSDSSSEFDLSKVKSLAESILGSKSLLENSLGSDGTGIVDAASKVKEAVEKGLGNDTVKKALALLKKALAKVEGNALCASLAKKLEALGV